MVLIDTHVHLYADEFHADLDSVISKAKENGVVKMLMPNVDIHSINVMNEVALTYPGVCFPMIGLHPCYVKEDFQTQLEDIKAELDSNKYIGVGEIGLDLYWDKTFYEEQKISFETQLKWAIEKNLPVSIHSRSATREALEIIKHLSNKKLKGVFHCFSGTLEEANEIMDQGLYLGIGGVVTFKNGGLDKILPEIPLKNIVLETDAPYLAPIPFRGKRNESSYLTFVAKKVAEIYNVPTEEVSKITSQNANSLFTLS
ncbi:MAG: TatD family hydrolase [Opitutaceae bacterium]|nr:TatD family hydrolase [Cytophagales bacterium]